MTDYIPLYVTNSAITKIGGTPMRVQGYIFGDDFAREVFTPTGFPTLYTAAEVGAAGSTSIDATINRANMITDATGAGDNQSFRTSGLRVERNYTSLITGMPGLVGERTASVELHLPFALAAATDTEMFIGIHSGVAALSALPTTARHLGIYCDISAGANFMLSASDGTTQTAVDTTVAVDTAIHILRIRWTAEDTAALQLLTAAGATEGTGQAVAAFNGASGVSHEIHWFIETEAAAAKTMRVYPWRIAWT